MKNAKQKKSGLIISTLLAVQAAYALPQGAQVIQGSASIATPNSNTMNITNSNNAIINWQQFNIGAGQTTNFIQPNSTSSVLNRVIGNNPSQILGNLNSNGQVFLINQHGILVGEGAHINTNGFFASTLNITNKDFLQGNLNFAEGGLGDINNKGYIQAGENGNIVLIAPDIKNGGVIEVENGNIILASGESITITSLDNANIEFHVQSPDNKVTNLGSVIAKNGAANLFAGSLRHTGSIRATGLVRDENGIIRLVALDKAEVSGTVDVSGEKAGNIEILGDVVDIQQGANINASGSINAGEILIGGDQQGLNPDIKNATSTTVATGAQVSADGLGEADGGRVIVFASNDVHIQGEITATGGDIAGDGGFIETSGLKQLDITAIPDASAVNGEAGEWLIDPNNIIIQSTGGNDTNITATVGVGSLYDSNNDGAILSTETIVTALVAGTNVTITTGTAGADTELGNITVNDAINVNLSSLAAATSLTLNAHNDINIDANIGNLNIFGADFNLTLTANTDNANGGSVNFNNTATISINGGTLILSGDSITVNGTTNINDGSYVSSLVVLNAPLTITSSGELVLGAGDISSLTVQGSPVINNGILTTNGGCGEGCGVVNFSSQVTNNGTLNFNEGVAKFNANLINNSTINMATFFAENTVIIGETNTSQMTLNTDSVITDVSGATWSIASLGTLDIPLDQNNIVMPSTMTLELSGGSINGFEKLTTPNTFNIGGGSINFNEHLAVNNTTFFVSGNAPFTINNTSFTQQDFAVIGDIFWVATGVDGDIILSNTKLISDGLFSINNISSGAQIQSDTANGKFVLNAGSHLVQNSTLQTNIAVPSTIRGTLEIVTGNSSLSITGAGGLTLQDGGRLAGVGTYVGDVIVGNGGQIAPGISGSANDNTGTLTVTGDVTFNSGSLGLFEIDVASDGALGTYDKLSVSGDVAINTNSTLNIFWDGVNPNTSITGLGTTAFDLIISAGITGITGVFDVINDPLTVTASNAAYTSTALSYDPVDVSGASVNIWTGLGNDTDWNNAANWSLADVPGAGELVSIEAPEVNLAITTSGLGTVFLDVDAFNLNTNGVLDSSEVQNIGTMNLLVDTANVTGGGVWSNFSQVYDYGDGFSYEQFDNHGSFKWLQTTTNTTDFNFTGSSFNNYGSATFNAGSNNNEIAFTSSTNGLINKGAVKINALATQTRISGNFDNSDTGFFGVLSPNSNAIIYMADSNTNKGKIFFKNANLYFDSGVTYTLGLGTTVTGEGAFGIESGSILDVQAALTLGSGQSVYLAGGILESAENLTITDFFLWTAGTVRGSNIGVFNTAPLALTQLGSASDTVLNGVDWVNDGHVNWVSSGGDFVINNATFTNSPVALETFSIATTSNQAEITGNGTFDNQAHLQVSADATSTLTNISTTFINNGQNIFGGVNGIQLNNPSHTLSLNGTSTFTGDVVFVDGATLKVGGASTLTLNAPSVDITASGSLGGTLLISADSTLDVAVAPSSFATNNILELSGGTIVNAQNLSIPDTFNWNGGTVTGSGVFNTGGSSVVNINASVSDAILDTISMNTAGTVSFNSSGNDLLLNNGAVWTNAGIFNIANTAGGADIISADSQLVAFINTGTINSAPALSTTNIDFFTPINNQGTINVDVGRFEISRISTSSGVINIASGATFALGSAFNNGTDNTKLTFSGTPQVNGLGSFLIEQNTALDVATPIVFGSGLTFNLAGGTIQNAQNLSIPGTFNISGGSVSGNGSTWLLPATATTNVTLMNNLSFNNMQLLNDGEFNFGSSANSAMVLNEVDITMQNNAVFNLNQGSINGSGLLTLKDNASMTIVDGFSSNIPMTLNASSTAYFEGGASLALLRLNGGTINIDTLGGDTTGDTLTVNNLDWVSGLMSSETSASLQTTGSSKLLNASLSGVTWNNSGELTWGGSDVSTLALSNAVFNNTSSGILNIVDDTVPEEGVINSTVPKKAAAFAGNSSFNNNGTINLIHSVLDISTGNSLNLATPSAVLNGTGTVIGNVNNSGGTVKMGNNQPQAGALEIDGNYNQGENATLVIRIVDPLNGELQFDTFAVTGTANLAGTLELNYFTNQIVSITESFSPFDFANRSGVFSTLVDSKGNILLVDFSNGVFTILGSSTPANEETFKELIEIIQSQEEFKKILSALKDEELDQSLAFIKEILEEDTDKKKLKKRAAKLVCR